MAVGEVSVAVVAGVHHLPVGRAGHPPDGQAVGKVMLLVDAAVVVGFQTCID